MYGAIEAGGTKFICAVTNDDTKIIEKISIRTTYPEETIKNALNFFEDFKIKSLGIGTFGPINIHPNSKRYGEILNTPKIKWRKFNIYKTFKETLNIPIKIDTDVNAAALGEYMKGHGKGKRSVLYITIGTGVGAGFVLDGQTLFGLTHPEMGHILIRQNKKDIFEGVCPIHKNCLEGLVSGPSIEARYGAKGQNIKKNNLVWEYIADYLGQALMNYVLILSPEIILIGGGVSQQQHLFPMIRNAFKKYINGYIKHSALGGDLENYIKYPKNGQEAGLIGSIYLAISASKKTKKSNQGVSIH